MALPAENNFQVSGTGGAGTNGQPTRYIPGMAAMGSSGVETMAQQGGAKMAGSSSQPQGLSELSPLTAETEFRDQPITDGAPIGAGANSVANLPMGVSEDPDIQSAREHLPILEWWASQPGATQSTKDYTSYLRTVLTNPTPGAPV